MFLSRYWLLLCSILSNVALILYIGSQIQLDNSSIPLLKPQHYQNRLVTEQSRNPSSEEKRQLLPEEITLTTKSLNINAKDDDAGATIACLDRKYEPETLQRGNFWVLKNYVRAEHGPIKCHKTITYTTHADFTYFDNLIPLLDRWLAPVSIALHAPGPDFETTLDGIIYLRECLPESSLVRKFVTFHIYFGTQYMPMEVMSQSSILGRRYNCSMPPPYSDVDAHRLYKERHGLLYPVNVGRNIARDAALTHFILASDIELYPSADLAKAFLAMIARNGSLMQRNQPKVFVLSPFEVESNTLVPRYKTGLQELLHSGKAVPFHKRRCPKCHNVPLSEQWIAAKETHELNVFNTAKRLGAFKTWEPIYIGTHAEPYYDERLYWEGMSDKMTQGYALCALNYEFHVLNNAFLVHKPGIKAAHPPDIRRDYQVDKNNVLIRNTIYPELKIMYGVNRDCAVN